MHNNRKLQQIVFRYPTQQPSAIPTQESFSPTPVPRVQPTSAQPSSARPSPQPSSSRPTPVPYVQHTSAQPNTFSPVPQPSYIPSTFPSSAIPTALASLAPTVMVVAEGSAALSTAAIAGIMFSSLAAIVGVAYLASRCIQSRRQQQQPHAAQLEEGLLVNSSYAERGEQKNPGYPHVINGPQEVILLFNPAVIPEKQCPFCNKPIGQDRRHQCSKSFLPVQYGAPQPRRPLQLRDQSSIPFLLITDVISEYNDDVIGEGGFAQVKMSNYEGTSRAIKLLKYDHEKCRESLINEVIILNSLQPHPHILPSPPFLKDANQQIQGSMMIKMEGDLFEFIHNEGNNGMQNPNFRQKYFTQKMPELLSAVTYLHQYGCVHRDLKPENILLNSHGQWILTDFGTATLLPQTGQLKGTTIKGSTEYCAPEILQSYLYTPAGDVFAIGIIGNQILSRERPYDNHPFFQAVQQRQPPLSETEKTNHFKRHVCLAAERPGIPPGTPINISQMIKWFWQQAPERRPSLAFVLQQQNF